MRGKHSRRQGHVVALVGAAILWLTGSGHAGEPGLYALTVTNTNTGQNFSPPVIILHDAHYRLFELGEPATVALWRLARTAPRPSSRRSTVPSCAR
jgi:hypothetical protein